MKCFQLSSVYQFSASQGYLYDLHMEGDTRHYSGSVICVSPPPPPPFFSFSHFNRALCTSQRNKTAIFFLSGYVTSCILYMHELRAHELVFNSGLVKDIRCTTVFCVFKPRLAGGIAFTSSCVINIKCANVSQ